MCTNVFYTCILRDDLLCSNDPLTFIYENCYMNFVSKSFIGVPDQNALCDYCLYTTYVWLQLKKRFPKRKYVRLQMEELEGVSYLPCPYAGASIETMKKQIKEVMLEPKKEQLHDELLALGEK